MALFHLMNTFSYFIIAYYSSPPLHSHLGISFLLPSQQIVFFLSLLMSHMHLATIPLSALSTTLLTSYISLYHSLLAASISSTLYVPACSPYIRPLFTNQDPAFQASALINLLMAHSIIIYSPSSTGSPKYSINLIFH